MNETPLPQGGAPFCVVFRPNQGFSAVTRSNDTVISPTPGTKKQKNHTKTQKIKNCVFLLNHKLRKVTGISSIFANSVRARRLIFYKT